MKIKEKAKELYEDNEAFIWFTLGMITIHVAYIVIGSVISKSEKGSITFIPDKVQKFPSEMPVTEIKEILRKEGNEIWDAVIASNGKSTYITGRKAL